MLLNGHNIADAVFEGRIQVSPFNPDHVTGTGLLLHLNGDVKLLSAGSGNQPPRRGRKTIKMVRDGWEVPAGGVVSVSTAERIGVDVSLAGLATVLPDLGLAGFIGTSCGVITSDTELDRIHLVLVNTTDHTVRLEADQPIVRVTFMPVSTTP